MSSGENDRNSISLDHVGLVDPGQEFGFCSKWNGTPMKDLKSRDGQLLKPDCDKVRILMIQKIWMIRIKGNKSPHNGKDSLVGKEL